MPIIELDTQATDTPEARFAASQSRPFNPSGDPTWRQTNLLENEQQDPADSTRALIGAHFRRSTLLGGDWLPAAVDRAGSYDQGRRDPGFDPYKLLSDKLIEEHPYMESEFEDGSVLDIPNEDAFWRYVRYKGADAADRETMNRHGFGMNLAAGLIAQAPEILLTHGLTEPFELASVANLTRNSLAARSAVGAGEAALMNLAQEEAIRALAPTKRNTDETEAALMALGMGTAFGAGMPLLFKGAGSVFGKAQPLADRAMLERLQKETAASMAGPKHADVMAAAAEENARAATMAAATEAPKAAAILRTPENAADIAKMEAAGTIVTEHPRQADYETASSLQAADDAMPSMLRSVPTSEIHVDPARFQFKADADKTSGAGGHLQEIGVWDPEKAGVVLTWRDPADGKLYVVNGHNRLALANRRGVPKMNIMEIEAKNAAEARLKGAEVNIAEGRGTAIDAAKVMREAGLTVDDMAKRGISMSEARAREGVALASLSDKIFGDVAEGRMSVGRGVAIGENIKDPGAQEQLAKTVAKLEDERGKTIPDREVAELAKIAAESPEATVSMGNGLFGEDFITKNLMLEKAAMSNEIRRRLSEDKRLFGVIAREKNAKIMRKGGNVIATDTNKGIADAARLAEYIYNQQFNKKGPISEALNEAATRLAAGEKKSAIAPDLYERIVAEIKRIDQGMPAETSLPAHTVLDDAGMMGPGGAEEFMAAAAAQQASANINTKISEVLRGVDDAQPQSINAASGSAARIAAMFTPGGRLREAPSAMARKVANLLFDNSWATRESADAPLTHQVAPTAESLKGIHDAKFHEAQLAMRDALKQGVKGGGFTHQLAGGETLAIKSTSNTRDFGRAVVDHLWREDAHARGWGEAPQSSPAVAKAAREVRGYFKHMGDEGKSLELMGNLDNYVPRQWKAWEIARDRATFVKKLIEQQRDNYAKDFHTGAWRDIYSRQVEDGVWRGKTSHLTPADVAALEARLAENPKPIMESELHGLLGDGMARYDRELEAFWRTRAESTFDTLTNNNQPVGSHLLTHGSKAVNSRVLDIDPSRFREYLHDDAEAVLHNYHHTTAGHLATRRAFRMDGEMQRSVKAITGIDPKAENFDPELMLRAVNEHFQVLMDAAKKDGNTKAIDAIENAKKSVGNDLTHKLNELHGDSTVEKPIGWKLLGQRLALRMPVMSYLGNLVASNISDVAAVTIASKMTPNQKWQMAKALNLFKEVPKAGLESLLVGTMDSVNHLRAARGMDIHDMPMGREYGAGTSGKVMETIDKATEKGTAKFLGLTGMPRFNGNLRRAMGHVVLEQLTDGARKMAQADLLRKGGLSEAEAIAKVGLSKEDATTLNRLGINGRTAKAIMEEMRNHGTDINGTKLGSGVDSHDGFIHPQFANWADQGAARTLMAAVSRHTTDLVLDPKLLSKPLLNRHWHGKVFNQMANFFYAWGNQQAVLAAQRPATSQAQYLMLAAGLGGLSDAIHNSLAGRRNLEETAEKWQEDPLAMTYGAIDRSALLGWLARPIAVADKYNLGPNRLMKNDSLSGTFSRADGPWEILGGPFASWAKSLASGTIGAVGQEKFGPAQQKQLWNSTPYHNLWFLNAGLRALEAAGVETPEFTHHKK